MIQFNSKYTGQYYQMTNGEVFSRTSVGVFKYASAVTGGTTVVQLTGYYEKSAAGNTMYQTTTGGWINLSAGWQYQAYAPIRMYSAKDAQYYVDRVIKCNATIFENNLLCARFADKLTDDERYMLYDLQTRLDQRNSELLSDGLCNEQKVSSPPGYSAWYSYLQSFMTDAISGVTATIVVIAIVVASLSTAAYFAYKYLASEAERDVKYSEELTKVLLSKLTPEEYDQLMRETQGIVTKQKLIAKFSGALSFLKWMVVGAAGFVLYNKFIKRNYGSR